MVRFVEYKFEVESEIEFWRVRVAKLRVIIVFPRGV